jgi:hypothetical protein
LSAAQAQSKNQDQRPQFTHAEVVQFIHTVQTEAAGWKDTINSVDPSAFPFDPKIREAVEKEKKAILLSLDLIEELSLPMSEKNTATDLVAEFAVYDLLRDMGYLAGSLNDELGYTSIAGVAKAGELRQLERETQKAHSALLQEIGNRIVNMARSEEAGGCK